MIPFTESRFERSKPLKVKEWAVERLKKGHSPKRITQDIQRLFGVYVAIMTVYRWRDQYIAATGENILLWHKFNKTAEQKSKNKSNQK